MAEGLCVATVGCVYRCEGDLRGVLIPESLGQGNYMKVKGGGVQYKAL